MNLVYSLCSKARNQTWGIDKSTKLTIMSRPLIIVTFFASHLDLSPAGRRAVFNPAYSAYHILHPKMLRMFADIRFLFSVKDKRVFVKNDVPSRPNLKATQDPYCLLGIIFFNNPNVNQPYCKFMNVVKGDLANPRIEQASSTFQIILLRPSAINRRGGG